MSRLRVVIQSRLTSSRLPGKAMLTVAGRPAVVLVAQRAAATGHEVIVATSDQSDDDVIAEELSRHGIATYRGSLSDPLGRIIGATADLGPEDLVVRLTADNVVPDGEFIDEIVADLRERDLSYVRVATGLPYGLGAEAFTVGALRAAGEQAADAFDREHVTPWIRRNVGDAEFAPSGLDAALHSVRCTMDTLADYVLAVAALRSVGADPVTASWRTLVQAWFDVGAVTDVLPLPRHNAIGQGRWVLGTVQLGLAYGAANATGVPDEQAAGQLLATAAAHGVTHLDTARAYGISEAQIGAALAHGLSERLQVVTKVRPLDDVAVDGSEGHAREAVRASVSESLRQLRTAKVSALLLHRWADWQRGRGAVAEEMSAIAREGTASVVGVSLSTPEELIEALADPRIGYVQLPFNLLDRRWLDDRVRSAVDARPDVIITARSVFLQGLLVAGPEVVWPSAPGVDPSAVRRGIQELVAECDRVDAADLCIAYVMGHPFVTSVVLGAETARQVIDQASLMRRPPLTADEIARVNSVLPAGPLELVDPSRWTMSA